LKSVSGKRFCNLLENKGWELKRVNGSHHIYMKIGVYARISVHFDMNVKTRAGA
jgi:predicted RNA binding protein YcfA (HicA-like mRNA interferase family)